MFLDEEIEELKKKGKILPLSEAFKRFPVHDEWHKGKMENVICDGTFHYPSYRIGDIVYVENFVYSNGNDGNDHFFVIVDKYNIAVPFKYFGMILSSKIKKLRYSSNLLLLKNEINKLKFDSVVKADYLYFIRHEDILFKIGNVEIEDVDKYLEEYRKQSKIKIE